MDVLSSGFSYPPLSASAATCIILAIVGVAYHFVLAASHKHSDGRPPPSLPFAIPLLGHLPEFLYNTQKFLKRAT